MKYSLGVAALWALAIIGTAVIVADQAVFTSLGPLYAVCMTGSVLLVRRAAAAGRPGS